MKNSSPGIVSILIMIAAAALEVGGDALCRRGLRSHAPGILALGFVVVGGYGIAVNLVNMDFSRLLGAYVGIFACLSVLTGRFFFGERVAIATWVGLGVVLAGSLIIQFGDRAP